MAKERMTQQKRRVQWGGKQGNSKLTREQVQFIRASELTAPRLAKRFKVSVSTIRNVRRGRTYSSVPKRTV